MNKPTLIRITTVAVSLEKLLEHQLDFMNQYYKVIAVSSDEEDLKRVAAMQGVAVFCVELTRKITPVRDLKSLYMLYRFLKREKPFIVHTHTPKAGIVGMMAAKLAGVPYRLHTVAGLPLLEARGLRRKLLNAVEKLTYACATRIYPNSLGLQQIILENHYTKAEKVRVLANGSSNGIDTSYFNPSIFSEEEKSALKKRLKIPAGNFVFVFVGRMVGDKGINELIAAFRSLIPNLKSETRNLKLETQNPKPETSIPKLLLVGPFESELDPLSPETLQEIESNPNIVHVGFQPDVRPYFAIANALVFPSYREGFPNVVMQAGAMELPSIVSNINGCNEIIIEGKNGTIIPPKDTEALCHAMKKMMSGKDYYNGLKENARRMIVERYEQRAVWEAILAEYRSLEEK